MDIRIEVCQTNQKRHAATAQVLERISAEFPGHSFSIHYEIMKCGGICAICKTTPYVLVNKKFISGINAEKFYDNLKNYILTQVTAGPVA